MLKRKLALILLGFLFVQPVMAEITHVGKPETLDTVVSRGNITTKTISADDVTLSSTFVGAPTYKKISDYYNTSGSVGKISGGTLALGTNAGTMKCSAGTGMVRTTASNTGALKFIDFPATDNIALTNNSINYLLVKYNGGTPQVVSEDTFGDITFQTDFVIGYCWRDAGGIDYLTAGNNLPNYAVDNCIRLFTRGIEHMSGAAIAEKATRYVTATAGVFYLGECKISTPAFDSSSENFENYFYLLNGSWTTLAATGQIDNLQYNNVATPGSESLDTLTTNRYGVHWIYICPEGDLNVVLGQGDYTASQATAAEPPSSLPTYLSSYSSLAGKIIIKKSATTFTSTENAFIKLFVPTVATTHNNLAGLNGGTTDEYYHLTSSNYNELYPWIDAVTLRGSGSFTCPGTATLTAISGDEIVPRGSDPDLTVTGAIGRDTNDHVLRGYDGTNQYVYGMKKRNINVSISSPLNLVETTAFPVWKNNTGMTFVITAISADSTTDNADFILNKGGENDYTNVTQIKNVVVSDDKTGVYTTRITSGFGTSTIEPGRVILFNNGTVDAKYVEFSIIGYFNGDRD